MSKRIEIDGKFYRKRKGKLVQIPDEWVGKIPTEQTMRKRKEDAQHKRTVRKNRIRKLRDEQETDDWAAEEDMVRVEITYDCLPEDNDELP